MRAKLLQNTNEYCKCNTNFYLLFLALPNSSAKNNNSIISEIDCVRC